MTRTLLIAVVVLGVVGGAVLSPAVGAERVASAESASSTATTGALAPTDLGVDSADDARVNQANGTEFPPGLNESGVTDPLALVERHRATLRDTSYTTSTSITFRRPNGTLVSETDTTARVAPGGESFYVTSTGSETNATRPLGVDHYRIEAWANETDAVVADTFRGEDPQFRQVAREDAPLSPDANWELLYSAFGTVETELVGTVERDGETLYKVASASPTDEAVPGEAPDFSALVGADGVVHSFQMTQRSTMDGEPVIVSRTMWITQVGATTVERPDWYDRAIENESGR